MISLTLSPQLGQELREQGETSDLAYWLSERAVWLSPTETVGGDAYHYRLEFDPFGLRDLWHEIDHESPTGPAAEVVAMLPARPPWLDDRDDGSDLAVCTDCIMLLANGSTEGIDAHYWLGTLSDDYLPDYRRDPSPEDAERAETAFLAAATDPPGWWTTPGSMDCEWCGAEMRAAAELSGDEITECEPWFSRSSCDSCGCHLGGDRHHAHCSPLPAKVDA